MFIPPPPDPDPMDRLRALLARNAAAIREAGLGVLAFGCALAPLGFGGDMLLTAIVLSVGWVLGTIGLGTAPKKSIAWKFTTIILLAVFFCAETAFLYWHFHGIPEWITSPAEKGVKFAEFIYVPPVLPTAPKEKIVTPWVSKQEIDDQLKFGKVLLVYSPEELLSMSLGSRNMTIFYGNWIKLDYPVLDIPQPEKLDKNDLYVIKMFVNSGRLGRNGLILAYFYPQKWRVRLLSIHAGDQVKAICQLRSLQSGPLINSLHFPFDELIAENCDFL